MFCNYAIRSVQQAGATGEGGGGGAEARGLSSRLQADRAGTQPSPPEGSLHKVSPCPGAQSRSCRLPSWNNMFLPGKERVSQGYSKGDLHSRVNRAHSGVHRTACVLGIAAGWAGFSLLIPPPPPPPPQERV